MTIPTVTPYTGEIANPDGSQTQTEFTQNMFDQLSFEKNFVPELNNSIAEINSTANQVDTDAVNAAQSASDAQAAADSVATTQFVRSRIGNISDYVGGTLTESERFNIYQYPDDSDYWYGVKEGETFPVTIPADPSSDNGWALTTAATQMYVEIESSRGDSQLSEGSIWPQASSSSLPLGPQSVSIDAGISRLRVDTGSGVELLYLWGPSGDFQSLEHVVSNISENSFSGYDVVTDQGTFEFQTKKNLDYRFNLDSRGWGLVPSPKTEGTPTVNQTSQILKVRDYVKNNQVTVTVPVGNVLCDGDALDFKDCTVGGFRGAGVDKTQFFADTDNTLTAWFDLGTTGSDIVPITSDIQFGNFGGFSLRCNGKAIAIACSHNFFRRGEDNEIRVYDAQRSFFYDYCWLNSFGPMRSQNHTVRGHEFGGSALNALTFYGLEASSTAPNVRDYSFLNPNTVLLVSPDTEGLGGGMYFEDGRSVTLLNAHFESESTKIRTASSSNNGLCINIVGGASFNSPEFFKMPDFFQALTITNFSLYDVGADLSGIAWQINARKVIINNLNVVDSNKNIATRRQVRDWVKASLGASVDFCSVDGEIVRVNGVNTLIDESDRFFDILTTPGTPVDIDTSIDIVRQTIEVTLSQRTSPNNNAAVKILATVDDDLNLTQSEIANIKNGTTNIALGYNATTKRLTVDSSFGISTKIKIEYWRS